MDTRRTVRSTLTALVVAAVLGATTTVTAAPAAALAPDEVGVWPQWQVSGSTATAVFPASAAFPVTTLTTDQTRPLTAPSGESAFLGDSTALGQEFGSSRAQPYLSLGPAGVGASVASISFDGPQPAGWGFALGDIDADWVYITAYAGPGLTNPLTLDQLGFRGAGNYCTNVPKPTACGAAGPYTDQPTWVAAAENFDGIDYVSGTLRGSATGAIVDTAGAYAWFTPTAPIQTLQLMFGIRRGIPTGQLWIVAPAPKVTVTGSVVVDGGTPPGTVAEIREADGDPILDIEELPFTVPVAPDGTYTADLPQDADGYQVVILPPAGFTAPEDPLLVPGIPPGGTTVVVAPSIVVTADVDPAQPAAPSEEESENLLAASGATTDAGGAVLAGASALLLGLVLLRRARRVRA